MVVKLWHRESAGGMRAVLFFQQFAPAAGPLVARCYCAHADEARGIERAMRAVQHRQSLDPELLAVEAV